MRYFELLAYPFLFVVCVCYTREQGAGNIADGTMEGALEWASCSLKSFFEKQKYYFVYMYICVNVISYVLIPCEEGNLLKY